MDKEEVRNRVKSLLKEKGLTQLELAEIMGKTQSVISEMISGKRNILPLVEKLCELYGFSRDYIITGKEGNIADVVINNNIGEGGLSDEERKRLVEKIGSLYDKHQDVMLTVSKMAEEANNLMREIIALNKILIVGTNV